MRNEDQPRILVLGAGLLHAGHYQAIRTMGCFAIAMDRNPHAPARLEAEAFVCSDPGDVEQVIRAARQQHADAILPLSEFGVVPAAIAAEQLGLRQISPNAARLARDKFLMRETWAKAGLEQPAFCLVSSLREATQAATTLGFPLVIKPRCQFGARGVRLVASHDELAAGLSQSLVLSPDGVLVERRIEGIETSVEGLVLDGSAVVLTCADKELRAHPQFRVTRSINYPGAFSDDQVSRIETCAQSCTGALGLQHGPFHLEVFVCGDKILPIECGARGGGGHIFSHIVKLVSGVDLVQATVRILLGQRPSMPKRLLRRGACYRFLFPPEGRFLAVHGEGIAREDERVVSLSVALDSGDTIREPEHGAARAGYLVTRGDDRAEAVAVADWVERVLQWEVQ
jgi:biotin carboxylase